MSIVKGHVAAIGQVQVIPDISQRVVNQEGDLGLALHVPAIGHFELCDLALFVQELVFLVFPGDLHLHHIVHGHRCAMSLGASIPSTQSVQCAGYLLVADRLGIGPVVLFIRME